MIPTLSVTFLGTSASWPTAERGCSAIAVKRGGEILLFDCGEGTQRQFQRSGLSYQQTSAIFVTHYHGDHCYGIPGLLKTMALNERQDPICIYGPRGLQRMVEGFRRIGGMPTSFDVEVEELEPGDVIEGDGYDVVAHGVDHSVRSLAYRLEEHDRPGKFDKPRALELGVPEGRLFGQLQRGNEVALADGTIITPDMVLGEARPGRRIAYSGDTQPCPGLQEAAEGADLFICEATFTHEMVERAREVKHMTAGEAAATALAAGARQLVLTHISPRYRDADEVLDEAKAVFPGAQLAKDFLTVEVPVP